MNDLPYSNYIPLWWYNVAAQTYSLSIHLETQFRMMTLTCTQMFMWFQSYF